MLDYITNAIRSEKEISSFIVTNLTKVKAQYALWMRELPFVEPMYAVKCNPNLEVIRCLADLGCGFDCATMGEMKMSAKFCVPHPADASVLYMPSQQKMDEHLRYALKQGVTLMVFDCEEELYKIVQILHEINEEDEKKRKYGPGAQPLYGSEALHCTSLLPIDPLEF